VHGHLIRLDAKPGKRGELIDFLRWDADVARTTEPGTLRFDVWAVPGEPDALYLYDAYVDQTAFDAHRANAPYVRFVDQIVPDLVVEITFLLRGTEALATNAD
jgi:autoinducer 2-degrading protein